MRGDIGNSERSLETRMRENLTAAGEAGLALE
jgi:hypothetical protein